MPLKSSKTVLSNGRRGIIVFDVFVRVYNGQHYLLEQLYFPAECIRQVSKNLLILGMLSRLLLPAGITTLGE